MTPSPPPPPPLHRGQPGHPAAAPPSHESRGHGTPSQLGAQQVRCELRHSRRSQRQSSKQVWVGIHRQDEVSEA